MHDISFKRPTWKATLEKYKFLPLPVAHDALTARLIERAGFKAYQIGGFALAATLHAVPDIDLEQYGEIVDMVENIMPASKLPVLVDTDDGYGDTKNVTRTVQGYQFLGASAIFMEDQVAPKKCGHMADKSVVPVEEMVKKVKAAVAAKTNPDFFILARTDAIAPNGLDDALMRGEQYLKAGADGVYFEGPNSEEELEKIGKAFKGVPLATSVLERGGKTPALKHKEFQRLGYSMVLYPSTVIFQVAYTIQRALKGMLEDQPAPPRQSLDMGEFEQVLDLDYWKQIQDGFNSDEQ
ncbi:MAG TPA: isocitrate lyase/phosphoenolpyruvate mutase family protein [Fimbriimonas sp.]|nr:isocitrate lyase/phosphoenolpyruvate mutase family protein [Fimbriimonas sp.]